MRQVLTDGADWLLDRLELDRDLLVLDVAAGTGHVARALAPRVRGVVAVDATAAMLDRGKQAAEAAGLRNIVFAQGDAANLPFLGESFDVVVCRFAVHHFEDPWVHVSELARCVRAGGSLVVADLVCAEEDDVAATQNELERLRDPSHTRALAAAELVELINRSGMDVRALDTGDADRPLQPWLAHTRVADDIAEAIETALRSELAGGRATGFRPREYAGVLHFVQRFVSVTADKPLH